MAKLVRQIEATSTKASGRKESQWLDIVAEAETMEDAGGLDYSDFKVYLYIDGKYKGEISAVLMEMSYFKQLIDDTDWQEIYKEEVEGAEQILHD